MSEAKWRELIVEASRGCHADGCPAGYRCRQCETLAALAAKVERIEAHANDECIRVTKNLLARAETAEADAKAWKDATLNLAAVLHGDGGHWQTRPMTAVEVKEACVERWAGTVKKWDGKVYAAEAALAMAHTGRCICCETEAGGCGPSDHAHPFIDPCCIALRALVRR